MQADGDYRSIPVVLMSAAGAPAQEDGVAYAQLYSRVGFVHLFRPLATGQLERVIAHKWAQLDLTPGPSEALMRQPDRAAAWLRMERNGVPFTDQMWLVTAWLEEAPMFAT